METLTLINGNGQPMTKALPLIYIHGTVNDAALAHITESTELVFKKAGFVGYEAQPTSSDQIVRLLLTYNFKTRYFDNLDSQNTLHLKNDHHNGFDVGAICHACCKRNRIHTGDMPEDGFMSC